MSKAKWLILFLLALVVAVPSYAVELTLGGFPSYMRTRAHFIKGATFLSSISDRNARRLGFNDNDDNIMFVDTRLRLTPQLVLSDKVTIRAQVDVFDNNIWGGIGSGFVGNPSNLGPAASGTTLVNSADTPNSRFRGALLTNQIDGDCARGLTQSGRVSTAVCNFFSNNSATDEAQFFNVRMLHADIVLPYDLGFVRVGRQPFDWGLGILANGGWDPQSDLGFVLDRFLWLKSWGLGGDAGTFTLVFVSDRFTQGQSLTTGLGDGWDGGAIALIYNNPNIMGTNFTLGGYVFPYIHQENVLAIPPTGGPDAEQPFDIDLKRLTLWAGVLDVKTDLWRFVGEIQGAQGTVDTFGVANDLFGNFDIKQSNLLFAVRGEVYPGWPVKLVAAEFGWAGGDNTNTNDVEGNAIVFSPAYNLDQLMYKHIIPNIYRIEGSVINSFYGRAWGTVKLLDPLSFTGQVVVGWNQKTTAPLYPAGTFGEDVSTNVNRYLGTEIEGTLTWQVWPGVNFDLIGSLVFAGSGLKQLTKQQASAVMNATSNNTVPNEFNAFRFPWAVQGRLLIYIDQFFK